MSTNTSSDGADRAVHATRAARAAGVFRAAWAALTAGSRAVPFGDNGALLRDLAARIAASNNRRIRGL
jgi:hypothetical protein